MNIHDEQILNYQAAVIVNKKNELQKLEKTYEETLNRLVGKEYPTLPVINIEGLPIHRPAMKFSLHDLEKIPRHQIMGESGFIFETAFANILYHERKKYDPDYKYQDEERMYEIRQAFYNDTIIHYSSDVVGGLGIATSNLQTLEELLATLLFIVNQITLKTIPTGHEPICLGYFKNYENNVCSLTLRNIFDDSGGSRYDYWRINCPSWEQTSPSDIASQIGASPWCGASRDKQRPRVLNFLREI